MMALANEPEAPPPPAWSSNALGKITRRVKSYIQPADRSDSLPLVRPTDRPHAFDNYLFICGLHRSGTTLLERHLRGRFDVSALSAPVPESEGQHLQDVYPAAKQHGGAGRFAFAPEMRPAAPDASEAEAHRARLLECWSGWVTQPTATLLEKSPPNLTKIAWLRSVFPGARFIILTRDPRAVAGATMKWAHSSLEELVYHWHVAHSVALCDEADDCIRVRYEDFCADPEDVIERLATFLHLSERRDPEEGESRFAALTNSNAKYIDSLPTRCYGPGCWTEFGYDLTHPKRMIANHA